MKAIVVREFGEPEVMKIAEVAKPEAGPGQVVVRVMAAGVNPADTYMRSGSYAMKPSLPYTPGSDGAGMVESAGAGVSAVKPGQRVYLARSLSARTPSTRWRAPPRCTRCRRGSASPRAPGSTCPTAPRIAPWSR